MTDRYRRVLEAIAEHGNHEEALAALEKLILHLKSHGRVKLLPEMARELKRITARRAALAPVVEVAHQHDAHEAVLLAEKAGIQTKHTKVNHELLGGWRARAEGKLIDHSGKGALVAIYQQVTN